MIKRRKFLSMLSALTLAPMASVSASQVGHTESRKFRDDEIVKGFGVRKLEVDASFKMTCDVDLSSGEEALGELKAALVELSQVDLHGAQLIVERLHVSDRFFNIFFSVNQAPTLRAGHIHFVLEVSESFRVFVAAIRAGEVDRCLGIECESHS